VKRFRSKIKDETKLKKFRIMKALYFDDMTYEEAAEEFDCSTDTIRRAKKDMVKELSVYIFGADGLRIEV
jgi:hypothetical protein